MWTGEMLFTLAVIAFGAVVVVGASVAAVWWRQERMVYQPPLQIPPFASGVRRVDYVAEDGQLLYGLVAEPEHAPRGVLIAFHGNADLATWQTQWGKEVARRTGWRVLLAEYRGYGNAGGTPDYRGIQCDARAAWHFARNYLAPSTRSFALFGHSLGSAVATELAVDVVASTSTTDSLVALLLQSPFTSARDMARVVSMRPVQLLWKLIARVHYDTRSRIVDLDTPVWIAHGAHDRLVPMSMGRDLFAAARSPGRLLEVLGAGHNDVDDVAGESYWQWMSDALTARCGPLPTSRSGSKRHIETSG